MLELYISLKDHSKGGLLLMLKGWDNMTMYEQYRYSSCPVVDVLNHGKMMKFNRINLIIGAVNKV